MSLRQQLLCVSLLLLALPWAGCQFVRETENTLQHGQEQALLATSRAVAASLAERPALLYPQPGRMHSGADEQALYASPVDAPIILDGYGDGWDRDNEQGYGPVTFSAAAHAGRLYLLVSVQDPEVVYHDPGRGRAVSGDRLLLRGGNGREFIIATAAPGALQARYQTAGGSTRWEVRIRGYWQETLAGYSIELELPLDLLEGRLGFYVVNEPHGGDQGKASWHGNIDPGRRSLPPWLIYSPAALRLAVHPFAVDELRLRVIDRQGWVVAEADRLGGSPIEARDTGTHWLLRAVYRAALSNQELAAPPAERPGRYGGRAGRSALDGQPSAAWFQGSGEPHKLLETASPIHAGGEVIGAVVLEQHSERYLSLTDQAFGRLLSYSLAVIAVAVLGLLAYASLISWRVRRLAGAVQGALDQEGRIRGGFPVSRARDELGDLSRQYAELLEQLHEYHEYLRSLSRKLAHELRTPIAVIRSSLDNLAPGSADQVYLRRAGEGLARLNRILTAMSEANLLEESIQNNAAESFDLVSLCRQLFEAYHGLYADHRLTFDSNVEHWPTTGTPDLVAQMLDKLFANASDFCPAGGHIGMTLRGTDEAMEISVDNDGPLLPEHMQAQLFDAMVSVREVGGEGHLGLGLRIVRLIAEFHGGSVQAENRRDGTGVVFRVRLPRR